MHECPCVQMLMYVSLALMCVFIGIKVVTVFLTAYDAWNPRALFATGEDVGNQESKRGIHDLEHDSGNVASAEDEEAFAQGTRIVHPSRGLGVIAALMRRRSCSIPGLPCVWEVHASLGLCR